MRFLHRHRRTQEASAIALAESQETREVLDGALANIDATIERLRAKEQESAYARGEGTGA